MCGIVGYVGGKNAQPILLDSIKRLEYRGYDSSGIAVAGKSGLHVHKRVGEIKNLEAALPTLEGTSGIAHTRWATHGPPTENNAHPFVDNGGRIALIHNGILENYEAIKERLMAKGVKFSSETDSEVLVHLIAEHMRTERGDLVIATRKALTEIGGSYAIAIVPKEGGRIVAARKDSPLVVGLGTGENFVASDVPALLKFTNRVIYLDDGEMVVLDKGSVTVMDMEGNVKEKEVSTVEWTLEDAEKSGYKHFMLKEIFEQPKAVRDTLRGRIPELDLGMEKVFDDTIDKVSIVACGTSYHAGLVGKYMFERLAGIPTTVNQASEFRFAPSVDQNTLVVAITQSGESLDTLMAIREAKNRGCRTAAICNVVGSAIMREVDYTFLTRAGPEIGVAATKTFSTQLVALVLMGTYMGRVRGNMAPEDVRNMVKTLRNLPRDIQMLLSTAGAIKLTAEWIAPATSAFFIGRNLNYPSALEGALKLKEISYIHAEGFAAGELKHGPIALFTKETPVVAIAIKDVTYQKMVGNIKEVSARGAPVIAIGFEGDTDLGRYADIVLSIPPIMDILSPVLTVVLMQLIAYYVADVRGCSIDKPRNLAKCVTVE